MARIRTIKPEFWTSEQVMECSTTARLLFIGMLNFCDDGGNHPASAKRLKAQVFPSDDITTADIEKMVSELVSTGLISEYSAEDRCYWHVTGWHHQKIEKPTFKHPPYKPLQVVGDKSANSRREGGDASTPEGKGKGREVNQKETAAAASEPPSTENPEKLPPPLSDSLKARAKTLADRLMDLESKRLDRVYHVSATDTRVLGWAAACVKDPQFREAYEIALERRKNGAFDQPISPSFLDKLIREVMGDEARPSPPIPVKAWHETASGIEAKAAELGLTRRFDEAFPLFRARVEDAVKAAAGTIAEAA